MKDSIHEAFEGENSSLRKTYEKATSIPLCCPKCNMRPPYTSPDFQICANGKCECHTEKGRCCESCKDKGLACFNCLKGNPCCGGICKCHSEKEKCKPHRDTIEGGGDGQAGTVSQ